MICPALTGHPCELPTAETVGELAAGDGGMGWSGGDWLDDDREYCVDPARLAAFLRGRRDMAHLGRVDWEAVQARHLA